MKDERSKTRDENNEIRYEQSKTKDQRLGVKKDGSDTRDQGQGSKTLAPLVSPNFQSLQQICANQLQLMKIRF